MPAAEPNPGGWRVVAGKELADHVRSIRFGVLVILVGLAAAVAISSAAGGIREAAPQASGTPALFLRLFTLSPERVPSFLTLVGWLAPLLGIAFGFDAINGERAQGTLPRLVAQPIHRDDVINGKFVAGLTVIGIVLGSLTLLVAGLGMLRLGLVPTVAEAGRMLAWLVLTLVYVAFWLGLAIMASVVLRRAATSALVVISAWLVLTLFSGLLVGLLADALSPVPDQPTPEEELANVRLELALGRLSPNRLYEEATGVLLDPSVQFVGFVLVRQLDRAVPSTLSLDQSLLLVWPQTVGLIALTLVCFAAAYVLFMRQEIRA